RLALLDARDLGDRIRLVRVLERAGQQVFLAHRLRTVARIDTAAAEEEQVLNVGAVSSVNDVRLHLEILVEKLGAKRVVRVNPAHPGGRHEDVLRFVLTEKRVYGALLQQIQLGSRASCETVLRSPV